MSRKPMAVQVEGNQIPTSNPLTSPRSISAANGRFRMRRKTSFNQSMRSNDDENTYISDEEIVGGIVGDGNHDYVEQQQQSGDDDLRAINVGDIISLKMGETGIVYGDAMLQRLGVEEKVEGCGSVRTAEVPFRICPKRNYRTKREFEKLNRDAATSNSLVDYKIEAESKALLIERLNHEKAQNAKLLQEVQSGSLAGLVYGDVVQLQHVSTGKFIGMKKGRACVNHNNKEVGILDESEEGPQCYFKLLPRFKVRSIGGLVYVDDEIVLESVHFHSFVISASKDYCYPAAEESNKIKMSKQLQVPKQLEVNGWLKSSVIQNAEDTGDSSVLPVSHNVSSFRIALYARYQDIDDKEQSFLNTLAKFRLFHLDFHGYLSASCSMDKGLILDTLEESDRIQLRTHNTPAHIPYLRSLRNHEPNNAVNMNAKSAWTFEPLSQFVGGIVSFNSPIRIKHVVSNKYLAVVVSGSGTRNEGSGSSLFYDCCLEDDLSGEANGTTSTVFRVVPTGDEGIKLRNSQMMVKIEFRAPDGRRFFLTTVRDTKPRFIGEKSHEVSDKLKSRVGFVEKSDGVEVFSFKPFLSSESALLDRIMSYIPTIKLFTHRYLSAEYSYDFPIDMCENMVNLLLTLLEDLEFGDPTPRWHDNIGDYITQASSVNEATFAALFGGEVCPEAQNLCIETKLLDTLFEAALAPYNHVHFTKPPFETNIMEQQPAAVQKFLYVAIQRILTENPEAMEYFSSRYIRTWRSPDKRILEPWRNPLLDQCEDGFGATVLLALLFKSSRVILHKIVNDDLLERFKALIKKCGPHPRLIRLFASTCWVENRPVRAFQEACTRKLWMNEKDRYSIGVTFHEMSVEDFKKSLPQPYKFPYTPIKNETHTRIHEGSTSIPRQFLGNSSLGNHWEPVVIVWQSSQQTKWGDTKGSTDRGGLYWAPQDLGLPSVGQYFSTTDWATNGGGGGGEYIGEKVPLEHLMWVLEPNRLCELITGEKYETAAEMTAERLRASSSVGYAHNDHKPSDLKGAKEMRKQRLEQQRARKVKEEEFMRKTVLALFIIDEIKLLTEMCRGRCMNAIHNIEPSFSYDLLLNMASNPWLPYRFRASIIHFVICLYVDRFPQISECGTPHLPEEIWIYGSNEDEQIPFYKRKSTIPVIDTKLAITHDEAFPEFYIPTLSSANGNSNLLISMPSMSKFYLLTQLCFWELKLNSGSIIHFPNQDEEGKNIFIAELLYVQQELLNFGFISKYEALQYLTIPNVKILDGRIDLNKINLIFHPLEKRYKEIGRFSKDVSKIKIAILRQFFTICDLRSNYRLAKLYARFKDHHLYNENEILKWSTGIEMFYEFEGLFSSNVIKKKYINDASKIDFALLSDKKDFEKCLVDILMYEDNELFAASLHLLDKCYTQRKDLVKACQNSLMIETPHLAVYGEVHYLRADITELFELLSTYAVWGVKSKLSGHFDDLKFGRLMRTVDTLLQFLYSPQLDMEELHLLTEKSKKRTSNSGTSSSPSSKPTVAAEVKLPIETLITKQSDNKVMIDTEEGGDVELIEGSRLRSPSEVRHDDEHEQKMNESNSIPPPSPGSSLDAPLLSSNPPIVQASEPTSSKPTSSTSATVVASRLAHRLKTKLMNSHHHGNTQETKNNNEEEEDDDEDVRLIKTNILPILLRQFEELMGNMSTEERVKKMFDELDSSGDGFLSLSELTNGIRNILHIDKKDVSNKEIENVFKEMLDINEKDVSMSSFLSYLAGGGNRDNYRGYFKDCDIDFHDNDYYISERIWCTNVAEKWKNKIRGTTTINMNENETTSRKDVDNTTSILKPCKYHQHILRACNLQSALILGLQIKSDLAFSGSSCTIGLKVESHRRLTLVQKAVLTLAKAFVLDDKKNQELLFKEFDLIHGLASSELTSADLGIDERKQLVNGKPKIVVTPKHINCYSEMQNNKLTSSSSSSSLGAVSSTSSSSSSSLNGSNASPMRGGKVPPITARKEKSLQAAKAKTGGVVEVASCLVWPSTIEELAQDLAISIFRNNEKLCHKIVEGITVHPIFNTFAYILNQEKEGGFVSSSPLLDFFSTVCMPTKSTVIKTAQLYCANMLANPGFRRINQSAARAVGQIPEIAHSGIDLKKSGNPYRMLRFLRVLIMHGNEHTGILLTNNFNKLNFISISDLLLEHTRKEGKGKEFLSGAELVHLLSPQEKKSTYALKNQKKTNAVRRLTRSMSLKNFKKEELKFQNNLEHFEEGGLIGGDAHDVLMLLGELADLLPLSEKDVRCKSLWTFVQQVVAPTIEHLANLDRDLTYPEKVVFAELVDLWDRLLTKIDNHSLLETIILEQYRSGDQIIEDMQDVLVFVKSSQVSRSSISVKTKEAIHRILKRCEGDDTIPAPKHSRKDAHIYPTNGRLMIDEDEEVKKEEDEKNDEEISMHLFGDYSIQPSFRKSQLKTTSGIRLSHVLSTVENKVSNLTKKINRNHHLHHNINNNNNINNDDNEEDEDDEDGISSVFTNKAKAFSHGLCQNEFIATAMQRRRYELLNLLESGVTPTDGEDSKYPGAYHITWQRLVRRMAAFARDHRNLCHSVQGSGDAEFHGTDTCTIIFNLLKDHLLKARTWALDIHGDVVVDAKGQKTFKDNAVHELKTYPFIELSDHEAKEYVSKQGDLLENGVVELVVTIVMNSYDQDTVLGAMAVELLDELQHGGNIPVRQTLYHFLITVDMDARFLQYIIKRIEHSFQTFLNAKKFGLLGHYGESLTSEGKEMLISARKTVDFLTHLCTGHFVEFQDFLREQPMYSTRTFDLVGQVIDFLCEIADSKSTVEKLGEWEILLVRALLRFLITAMLGPRPANQLKVALSDVAIALNSIVPAASKVEQAMAIQDPSFETMQALSFKVLSSCLEARQDTECHKPLQKHVALKLFYKYSIHMEEKCRKFLHIASTEYRTLTEPEEVRVKTLLESIAQIWILHFELYPDMSLKSSMLRLMGKSKHSTDKHNENSLSSSSSSSSSSSTSSNVLKIEDDDDDDDLVLIAKNSLIGIIEVNLGPNSKIRRTCFPLPLEAKYLTFKTKDIFLNKARLLTTEQRVQQLFSESDIFIAEMEWVRVLSEKSKTYQLVSRYLLHIKAVMYALVVLLNLNVLMSPPSISSPMSAYFSHNKALKSNERSSLEITFILGIFNFLGYFVIMIYVAITTVPIMIRETDKRIQRCLQTMEPESYTDLSAFKWWFVTLVFNVMFIIMHITNFPEHYSSSTLLYAILIFGINLPWTLSCIRNYIVVPTSPPQRLFVIVFDTLVTKPFFRNHLILQMLSIQGFQNTQYFTLMLFDIVNLSDRLANIVQALSFHMDSLGLVFYLFITTALTYASFGLQFFPQAFKTTYDGATVHFKSVLACFWFVFYNYATRGNLKGFLSAAEPKSSDWLPRLFFDTCFFIWVGIILFTSITALLVDALGKSRIDQAKRDFEIRNVCFICGLKRTDYDDYGLKPGSADFDDHIGRDHDPWIYISYVAYLKSKLPSRYTGIESFVRAKMEKHDSWVPSKTCVALEAQDKTGPNISKHHSSTPHEGKEELNNNHNLDNPNDIEKMIKELLELQKKNNSK